MIAKPAGFSAQTILDLQWNSHLSPFSVCTCTFTRQLYCYQFIVFVSGIQTEAKPMYYNPVLLQLVNKICLNQANGFKTTISWLMGIEQGLSYMARPRNTHIQRRGIVLNLTLKAHTQVKIVLYGLISSWIYIILFTLHLKEICTW